ncbi:MAG: hypothetical protein JOZ22_14405 [Acidobacteriia bacterium]|nr:hypothetical protein [Terriglobia bacterium]
MNAHLKTRGGWSSLAILTSFFCLAFAGCAVNLETGPPRHEMRTIDLDTSETARVDLGMGAGELRVGGGARALMNADFNYSVPAWKPEVVYHSFAGRADLSIQQPATAGHRGNGKYDWDLRLNNEIPVDLLLHFGAGKARLTLGTLNLRSVEVAMGVGQIDMDLRGMPKHDYDVRIRGGVGEATVYLPKNAGVRAKVEGGLGSFKVIGLHSEKRYWVNDWYDSSRPHVRVDIRGGIGQINLIAE